MLIPPVSALASQALKVVNLLPRGTAQRITQIVVSFDRDMRPLGDMAQDAASSPLIISPRPAGAYRWLDTRTLAYILDRPLVGASRLQIKVAKGAKALDGAVTAQGSRRRRADAGCIHNRHSPQGRADPGAPPPDARYHQPAGGP